VAVVAPVFTVTEPGALSVAFVFVKATASPPAGAALETVTVHVVELFGPTLAGLHESEDTEAGPRRPRSVLAFAPFMDADTVAVWSAEIVAAADAVKVPVEAPFVINNPEGVVRLGLLLLTARTLQPTEGFDSETVHVLEAPALKLVGTQATELGMTEVTRLIVTLAELTPSAAVTVEDWLLLIVVVVALKVAVVAAAATVTEAGTVSVAFVLVRVTLAPPAGAVLVRVTVHVLEAFGPRLVGLHTSDDTSTGATRETLALAELPL